MTTYQPRSDSSLNPHMVEVEQYSGPLDLLLQLIKKQKMDIFKIDIYKITQKYVEYLKSIPKPDLENAGDFIRMASILMHIKSKTLLPKDEDEEEETSQLKKNLVRLLVNYQRYQQAGKLLFKRTVLGRDSWKSHYFITLKPPADNQIEINRDQALFLLVQQYNQILLTLNKKKPHTTTRPLPSLLERVKDLANNFIQGTKTTFSQLATVKRNNYSNLLTFLSLLELSKLGFVSLFQKTLWNDIEVKTKKSLDKEAFILLNKEEEDWMAQKTKEMS